MPYSDPEKERECKRRSAARPEHKKRKAAYYRKHKARALATARRHRYLKVYGITPEDYDRKFAEQGGKCKICRKPPKKGRRLCVDHNHVTGEVRDLLCVACNHDVGILEGQRLQGLKDYLERWR